MLHEHQQLVLGEDGRGSRPLFEERLWHRQWLAPKILAFEAVSDQPERTEINVNRLPVGYGCRGRMRVRRMHALQFLDRHTLLPKLLPSPPIKTGNGQFVAVRSGQKELILPYDRAGVAAQGIGFPDQIAAGAKLNRQLVLFRHAVRLRTAKPRPIGGFAAPGAPTDQQYQHQKAEWHEQEPGFSNHAASLNLPPGVSTRIKD